MGIDNIGNTCYLNSALQNLINILPLRLYFLGDFYKNDININNNLSSNGKIANKFADLINKIKNINKKNPINSFNIINRIYTSEKSIDPTELCKEITNNNPIFDMHSQKDSIEFLTYFIDILHEDLNKIKNKPNINFNKYFERKNFQDMEKEYDFRKKFFYLKNQSFINDLLYGYLIFSFTCKKCNKEEYNFDRYSMISIPVGKDLEDSLKKFEEPFLMTDSNKCYCQYCKSEEDCEKKCQIYKIPYYLIIHFQRTVKTIKNENLIDIPLKFDFKNFIKKKKNNHNYNYELIGTINHYGRTSRSGHYIAFCKNQNNWYQFNDSMKSQINEKDVINKNTIIVIYEKTDFLKTKNLKNLFKKAMKDYTKEESIKDYIINNKN